MMSIFDNLEWSSLWNILRYDPQHQMIFSDGLFFILFLLFLPIYGLLRDRLRLRIVYVALFSLYFYYKSSGEFVLLLLLATTSDYLIGRVMGALQAEDRRRKWLMMLSILINLGILSYFKYFNFLGELVCSLLQELGLVLNKPEWIYTEWSRWDIILPVGISFYTFQTMSYIIDLYRGSIKPIGRWIDYVFYVSFFPQLVAGPIVRARDFIPQIYKMPRLSRLEYGEALTLILSGLFKKAIISDYIGINFVDRVFDAPTLYTGLENLLGLYGYALQIYCDFSGYSDMAIGIALLLGFRFNVNFDSPYQSASITEFWHRWHISLSTWLKDYLYISLGGNRKGKLRTYLNLMLTMLLGGLWHGAAWNFILWGGMHGVALSIHKLWMSVLPARMVTEPMSWWRRGLGIFITFHLVCVSFIFFRSSSMQVAWDMIGQIVGNFHLEVLGQFLSGYKLVSALIIVGYLLHFVGKRGEAWFRGQVTEAPMVVQVLLFVVLIFFVVQMRSAEIQPFIYFQF